MDTLINNLIAIVGRENVLSKPDELLVYECDGLPQHKHRPRAVVFPSSTEETSAIMRELARANVPFTPRGAGTGLSGGALALNSAVVIELARMRKILSIDPENRIAVVQPGVVNLNVSKARSSGTSTKDSFIGTAVQRSSNKTPLIDSFGFRHSF